MTQASETTQDQEVPRQEISAARSALIVVIMQVAIVVVNANRTCRWQVMDSWIDKA